MERLHLRKARSSVQGHDVSRVAGPQPFYTKHQSRLANLVRYKFRKSYHTRFLLKARLFKESIARKNWRNQIKKRSGLFLGAVVQVSVEPIKQEASTSVFITQNTLLPDFLSLLGARRSEPQKTDTRSHSEPGSEE